MDANAFVQMISNVGFPIACVVALFYLLVWQSNKHNDEVKKMCDMIDNNTRAIEKLTEKLEGR